MSIEKCKFGEKKNGNLVFGKLEKIWKFNCDLQIDIDNRKLEISIQFENLEKKNRNLKKNGNFENKIGNLEIIWKFE